MKVVKMPEDMPADVLDAACRAFVNGKVGGDDSTAAARYAKPMRRVYAAIREALQSNSKPNS